MAKKKKKEKQEDPHKEDKDLVLTGRRLLQYAKDYRRKFDWEWMVRNLFVRGYHFSRYHKRTGTIVFGTRTGVRIPVNLVGAHLRGVRNQVTSFQPKWEVLPAVTTETAFENARYSGKVLDHIYQKSQIKRKIKEVVNHSLIHSIGVWHFDVDKKGNIIINVIDPYDFYVDPNVKSPNINDPERGAEYVVVTKQLPIDYIKNNPNYENTEGLTTDNMVASSEYKRFLLQVTKRQYESQLEENQTIMVNQLFKRERDEKGKFKIRDLSFVDGQELPIRNRLIDEQEYPFEILYIANLNFSYFICGSINQPS